MAPLTTSRFWQRRVYEAIFLLSVVILVIYSLPYIPDLTISRFIEIPDFVAIGAGVSAVLSLLFYISKIFANSFWVSFIVYIIFSATTAGLIWLTGETSSMFVPVWSLIAFASAIFAAYGIGLILTTSIVAMGSLLLDGVIDTVPLLTATISSVVPVLIGTLIWRHHDVIDESTRNVKHLTNKLSEVANRSEIVINAIGDGVMAVNGIGVIELINPAAQKILGWSKQDAISLNYKSIMPMKDDNNHELDKVADPVANVLNTNQLSRANAINAETKSGKKIVLGLVVSPIGEPGTGAIVVFRDVTRERAEEREQAEFISTASHEMRTPVASIEGYLGLALNPSTATIDARAKDFILKAHEAAQHLGRLFQDLLDVSRSEDGRLTNTPRVVNLSEFVGTVVEGLQPKAAEKGLTLTYIPSSQRAQRILVPVLYANLDNDHVREILNNLIENAIKYTPTGEVTIDVNGTDDKIIVSVKDTGLGIPPEDLPHLFQKFYRVNNLDRQSIGGTGLGLYLSRRLTEAMQGRLWVESDYGNGSTFFVELPRISNEEADQLKQEQAQIATATANEQPMVPPATPPTTQPPTVASAPVSAPTNMTTQSPTPAPAPTVPRGQNLTREEIAQRVQQLQAMARQANLTPPDRPNQPPQP